MGGVGLVLLADAVVDEVEVSVIGEFPPVDDADVMDVGASMLEGTLNPRLVAQEVVEDHPVEPDSLFSSKCYGHDTADCIGSRRTVFYR